MNVHTSCPVCGSHRLLPRWQVNGYPIVSCADCSLVFVRTIVTDDELAIHYATNKDPVYGEDNVECLQHYYLKLRKLIEKYHPKAGRLLDVGCSGGWFFDVMTGWESHGTEIEQSSAALARERCGDRIFCGSFEDYSLRSKYFDVITMQDVFDHLRDPIATLEKCREMLTPGGILIIKVHNISCLYAKVSGSRFYAIVPPSHLFYYDRRTLRKAISRVGLRMTDSRFIGHVLKTQTVFWRLSRGDVQSLTYKFYSRINGSWLGNFKIRKNLHDIITVVATRDA